MNPEPIDAPPARQPNDPLHGVTLEMMVTRLVQHFGWEELGRIIRVRCFQFDPSVKSSLSFLRKTPWARQKVENLYLDVTLARDGKWDE
ncbi:MAG: VF530 family protein [Chthoniobacteraceae bacterium]